MIEGLSNTLPNANTTFSASDAVTSMSCIQATNHQMQKNQKDKIAQKEKVNETLLSILCETIECTFCNLLKSSSERLKKQNEQFEFRMKQIRSD